VALASFLSFAVGAALPVVPWFIGSGSGDPGVVAIGVVAATIVSLIGRLASAASPGATAGSSSSSGPAVTYALGRAISVNVG
jgi:VIT1/CCC1 family predicted Fe2+/Mn2+ transporter